jgi:O-antigen ligase
MAAIAIPNWFDRARIARFADGLAVATAASLPWSTSISGLLLVLWIVALVPTLDLAGVRRVLAHPAGGLPVLLWMVSAVGMLWTEASWSEGLSALRGPHKLLFIPLLLVQFRRSDKGAWVIGAFLASCTLLLAVSYITFAFPPLMFWREHTVGYLTAGIPTKDYLIQSGEFVVCAFAGTHFAIDAWRERRHLRSVLLAALSLAFLANIVFVATGRSQLIVFAALVVVIAFQRLGWKGGSAIILGAVLLTVVGWQTSVLLRGRVAQVSQEIASYRQGNFASSTGFRIELWKRSVEFVSSAPIVGHGTGSMADLFHRSVGDDPQMAIMISRNPHNMTLRVGIELGLLGVIVLYAMWAAHLMLFSGRGMAAWLGLGFVVSDVVSSLFLSHLFDFTTGWTYVFGVGVLGGMVLRGEAVARAATRDGAAGWRLIANAANE